MKRMINEEVLDRILRSIESLEYGSIQITVHDSQVTQLDIIEKQRFQLEKSMERPRNSKQ